MKQKLRIGFCKIGKSIKFRRKYWNSSGGDNEPLALLQSLANNFPDIEWYIVGRSDWYKLTETERLEFFPHNNIVDVWSTPEAQKLFQIARDSCARRVAGGDDRRTAIYPEDVDPCYDTYLIDYFNRAGFKLDHNVMLVGQMCIANLRHITKLKKDSLKTAQPLMMGILFSLPIMRWLNECEPPYVEIITDQLYDLSQPRDIIHMPTRSLGQLNCTYEIEHIKSYEDQIHIVSNVKSAYAPIETLFCVGRDGPVDISASREIDFAVIANERRPSRYPMLKEWILSQFDDVSIFGRWAEGRGSKTIEQQAAKIEGDARFKGSLHLDELHATMQNVKTTFVVPQHRGGATSKWCEMLHSGVVPFFHPNYDIQKNVPVPAFLRPRTPAELRERIKIVVDDDAGRIALVKKLRADLLHDGYYNGSMLSQAIVTGLYNDLKLDRDKRPKIEQWTPPPMATVMPPPPLEASLQEFFA